MDKKDFLSLVSPIVIHENKKRGKPLFASVVIAQSILETGWGTSQIMMNAKAIFGIKATSSWKGKVYNAKTKECYDGKTYTNIVDCFRAYNSYEESVSDYFDLITKLERYRKACVSESPLECIQAIKDGGYATDPNYVSCIMKIIEQNNLYKYDKEYVENVDNSVDKVKIEQLARDVIDGKYGNGEERKIKLGSLYNIVQKRVNEILNNQNTIIDEIAKDVIDGKYGNGEERKAKLSSLYEIVQKRVNEMLGG